MATTGLFVPTSCAAQLKLMQRPVHLVNHFPTGAITAPGLVEGCNSTFDLSRCRNGPPLMDRVATSKDSKQNPVREALRTGAVPLSCNPPNNAGFQLRAVTPANHLAPTPTSSASLDNLVVQAKKAEAEAANAEMEFLLSKKRAAEAAARAAVQKYMFMQQELDSLKTSRAIAASHQVLRPQLVVQDEHRRVHAEVEAAHACLHLGNPAPGPIIASSHSSPIKPVETLLAHKAADPPEAPSLLMPPLAGTAPLAAATARHTTSVVVSSDDDRKRKSSSLVDAKPTTAPKPSNKKMKFKHTQEHMPKRPFTPYNFFFSVEREKILNVVPEEGIEAEDKEERIRVVLGLLESSPLSVEEEAELEQRVATKILQEQCLPVGQSRMKTRKHRKSHGKVGFIDLTRAISRRWKVLPKVKADWFKELSKTDVERYKKAMVAFKYDKEGGGEGELIGLAPRP